MPPAYDVLEIGLTSDRMVLYSRLDARIDQMLAAGLLDEVRALHERGYSWRLPSMSGLGYAQLGSYLRGECSLDVNNMRARLAEKGLKYVDAPEGD